MEENKKSINWKSVLVVATFLLLVFSLAKINEQTENIDSLQNMVHNLQDQLSNISSEINSIYDNVDTHLKQETSLISGADFSIKEASEDMKSVELLLSVVPKTISDDMKVSVTIDGNTAQLQRQGDSFVGAVNVGLFVEYEQWPLLSITTTNETKTEYLEGVDVSYLFSRYLPTLYADMSGGSGTFSNGTLSVDLGFIVGTEPASAKNPVTFTSFTLVEEMNGEEISRQDITNEVKNAGESYETQYVKTFKASYGDELKVYVIAEDSLGYIHKTLAHYWLEQEDGAHAEAIYGGEMIFDKDGNLLYGDKAFIEY